LKPTKFARYNKQQVVDDNNNELSTKISSTVLYIIGQSATNFFIMEDVIQAFTCVLRHTYDANDIINNVNTLSDGTALAGDISDNDRLGILDFPDTVTQEANVAASTSLSKAELLERAASSPSELSVGEYRLLEQRFWLDLTAAEKNAQAAAERTLAVSEENWYKVTDQLKKARAMLYDNNEEAALLNAENEEWRRMLADLKEDEKREVESRLATAQPWVKQLWDENQAEKDWGYAVFCDPEAANEEYESKRDGALFNARTATGCGDAIGSRCRLQYLDWPDNPTLKQTSHHDTARERPELVQNDPEPGRVKLVTISNDTKDIYTTSELEARFQVLRHHFIDLRDRPSKRQKTATATQTDRGALRDGILRNVFLVIDQQCVESLLSRMPNVDDAWVYAVDPDYIQPTDTAAESTQPNQYRGYLRVRLQQLVNNFFDARRFHEDEFPMSALWRAAQSSRHHAFVSVKESEQQLWTTSRLVGSALRPEATVSRTVKLSP
jgi:uncharacterized pyridoxamine 5'-phosphate oxidase family protein